MVLSKVVFYVAMMGFVPLLIGAQRALAPQVDQLARLASDGATISSDDARSIIRLRVFTLGFTCLLGFLSVGNVRKLAEGLGEDPIRWRDIYGNGTGNLVIGGFVLPLHLNGWMISIKQGSALARAEVMKVIKDAKGRSLGGGSGRPRRSSRR